MQIEISRADRDMMHGVIDMHLHAMPCLYDRPFDEIDIARQAREVGYRALVLKSIYVPNADRVELVRRVVEGIDLFGGMVLNHSVGGINVEALRTAIGFGAKVVWLPTVSALNHVNYFGVPTYPWLKRRGASLPARPLPGIKIVDEAGRLNPDAEEVVKLAAEANLVLATGHAGKDEIWAVLRKAKEIGYRKVLLTHVGWHATDWPLDELKAMIPYGANFEFTINPCMPARQRRNPADFAKNILALGPAHCIAATDLGQHDNAHPIEGFRMFLRILMNNGLSAADIDTVARKNPARLLDLPPSGSSPPAAQRSAAIG